MEPTRQDKDAIRRWRAPESTEPASPDAAAQVPGASIGVAASTTEGLIATLKEGLTTHHFDQLQERLGITSRELAGIVGIAGRTLARRRQHGRFAPDESERVLRIARLYEQAVRVLGGAERAQRWLGAPRKALGGQSPLRYADTEPGARAVEDLLGRLEHGVFG